MENIKIKSLGPIQEADINFGDLTLFVGPQASGKSILLQLIKLITDKNSIETTLKNYGYVWGTNEDDNLERFFGEGMDGVWNKRTAVSVDGQPFVKNSLLPEKPGQDNKEKETIFYIPAQRVLCLNYGWPRFFTDFDDSTPYVLRDFSETLRRYLEGGFTHGESPVFPQAPKKVNGRLTDSFNESVFYGGEITVDEQAKKRLKLSINGLSLPFMTWSTGQKEFMPLLMAFYWLCPPTDERKKDLNTVIIEEPEMGLHPEAIKSIILQIIDLLSRGYRVIVSTHSPVLLEFAWAFNILKASNANDSALLELFGLDNNVKNEALVKGILHDKTINTHYFQNTDFKVIVKDISGLDAGSEDLAVSEWGGLSSFSSKASDIISNIYANNG
jgi:energy-coupling factor transporter ATP-binding protein EcfA2